MKKKSDKKLIKVDRIDSYIARYRANLKLQEELEEKRKDAAFGTVLRKSGINELLKRQ
jgi:hypothetical protein